MGVYKLTASNKCGNSSSQATLTVIGAPYFIRKPNPVLSVAEKKSIKIEAEINGIPLPEVKW